jgi:guanylate kinase
MKRGKLVIISGPSGAGKGTLVSGLADRVPGLWVSVSATTREARPGESHGREYLFMSPDGFASHVEAGGFLEHAEVHGNRYGTLREPVEERIARGEQVILEIDVQGAFQVKETMPEATLVFVLAPSMEELRRRIESRGSESADEVETRLDTAEDELELVGEYDYVIINDDVRRATDELAALIDSLREKE